MLPSPIFFPPVHYTRDLGCDGCSVLTLEGLCEVAGIPCRASGDWVQRRVFWRAEPKGVEYVRALPGYTGDVLVSVPESVTRHGDGEVARYVLQVVAYSNIMDEVARESLRFVPWARNFRFPGRPRSVRAKTAAERQRLWRCRQSENKQDSGFSR